MMATSISFPTKREHEGGAGEEEAWKKTKTEEPCSDDESMSDYRAEEEAWKKTKTEEPCSDDESMSDYRAEEEAWKKTKTKEDKVKEYQLLFWQLKGDRDRAASISSEKDVLKLLSNLEMQEFRKMDRHKEWHILPNSGDLSDYQRLAIYHSDDDSYYEYVHHCFSYDVDCKYQQFTEELNKTIQWDTTMADAHVIAEGIWKKHLKEVAIDPKLLHESYCGAIFLGKIRQEAKESIPLFVDLYKREVDGEDFVSAMKAISQDNGLRCYPLCRVLIEKTLEEEEGNWRWGCLRFKYDDMKKKYIGIPRGEASLDDNSLKDLITRYFEDCPMPGGDSYIDYVKDKIRVARELEILEV